MVTSKTSTLHQVLISLQINIISVFIKACIQIRVSLFLSPCFSCEMFVYDEYGFCMFYQWRLADYRRAIIFNEEIDNNIPC